MALKFQFNVEKLVQALAYLSAHRGVTDLTKLRAAKLLYFSDKGHLLRYGRPIVGDVYFCLDKGPVPSASLNIIEDVISPIRVKGVEDPIGDHVREFIAVRRSWLRPYPELTAKREPDLAQLSESEIEVLEEVARAYGKVPIGKLIEATHREPAWRIPNRYRAAGTRAEMPYELFFEDAAAEAERVLALAEGEQEDRDFFEELRS